MNNKRKLSGELSDQLIAQNLRPGLSTEFKRIKGGLLRSSRFGQSMAVIGGDKSPPITGRPVQAAAKFYEMHRRHLGLPEDQRTLGKPTVLRDRDIEIYSYEPRAKGLKVDGARVTLAVATQRRTNENMLIALNSDARFDWPVRGTFKMGPKEAVSAAAEGLGFRLSEKSVLRLFASKHIRVEKVLAPFQNALHRAFRVTPVGLRSELLEEKFGSEAVEVVVDAERGFIIRTRSTVMGLECQVSAYDENPVKSPRNIDRDTLVVDGRNAEIKSRWLPTAPNILENRHFDVVPGRYESTCGGMQFLEERTGRATGTGANETDFLYTYNDYPHISEANAFYHLNQARQMLLRVNRTFTKQTTAPRGQPLKVYVDIPMSTFNAWSSKDGHLEFWSNGGVCAAADADIIVHEYGHQVHFVLAPNVTAKEICETVADFIATIYAHDTTLSELYSNRALVTGGQILADDFSPGPYSGLREIYNDYRYDEDYLGLNGHKKSRILSGALMELHLDFFNEFGDEDYFRVPRILLGALPSMPGGDAADIRDATLTINLLLAILAWLCGGKYLYLFNQGQRVFTRRGLL